MGKTKATLDTNILISALGWEGNPKQVFAKVLNGEIELVISDKHFTELERVLDYIVTGDTDLLKLKEFRGIKIRTAKEFLKES